MRFKARVIPSGNATGVEIPKDVVAALGSGRRSPSRSTAIPGAAGLAVMRGQSLLGISAANRVASGIAEGDTVMVDLQLDTAPRVVAEPPDLAQASRDDPQARAAFDRLPFGLKRKHVAAVDGAKTGGDPTAQDRQAGLERAV